MKDSGSNGRSESGSTPSRPQARQPTPMSRRRVHNGPVMGTWTADDNKPIALVDSKGKHIVFYAAPRRAARAAAQSSKCSPANPFANFDSENEPSDGSGGIGPSDPMLSSPASLITTGFSHTQGHGESLISCLALSPPEAFYPFLSVDVVGTITVDDALQKDGSDRNSAEPDFQLNIDDFIDFGDHSDSDEQDEHNDTSGPIATATATDVETEADNAPPTTRTAPRPAVQPCEPSTPAPAGSLLEHFDKGVVSSFRMSHERLRNTVRTTPKGLEMIKGGRHAIAKNPISPLRKRRGSGRAFGSLTEARGHARSGSLTNLVAGHGRGGPVARIALPAGPARLALDGPLKRRITSAQKMEARQRGRSRTKTI